MSSVMWIGYADHSVPKRFTKPSDILCDVEQLNEQGTSLYFDRMVVMWVSECVEVLPPVAI